MCVCVWAPRPNANRSAKQEYRVRCRDEHVFHIKIPLALAFRPSQSLSFSLSLFIGHSAYIFVQYTNIFYFFTCSRTRVYYAASYKKNIRLNTQNRTPCAHIRHPSTATRAHIMYGTLSTIIFYRYIFLFSAPPLPYSHGTHTYGPEKMNSRAVYKYNRKFGRAPPRTVYTARFFREASPEAGSEHSDFNCTFLYRHAIFRRLVEHVGAIAIRRPDFVSKLEPFEFNVNFHFRNVG